MKPERFSSVDPIHTDKDNKQCEVCEGLQLLIEVDKDTKQTYLVPCQNCGGEGFLD